MYKLPRMNKGEAMNKVITWKSKTFIGLCGLFGVAVWPAVAQADPCNKCTDSEDKCKVYGPNYPCNCTLGGCEWCESWTINPACQAACELEKHNDLVGCLIQAVGFYGAADTCASCIGAAVELSAGLLIPFCYQPCGLAEEHFWAAYELCQGGGGGSCPEGDPQPPPCWSPPPGDVKVADWGYGDRRWMADVNGDGITDYCRAVGEGYGPNSFLGCSLSIASSGHLDIMTPVSDWGYGDRRWFADVNGDGSADYCRAVGEGSGANSFLGCSLSITSSGALDIMTQVSDWGHGDRRWFVDVNGDGKDDFCRAVGDDSGVNSFMGCSLDLATSGQLDTQVVVLDWATEHWRWFADVNGDGSADFCREHQGWNIACSTSITSSSVHDTVRHFNDWGYGWARWLTDANGDGKADYCRAVGNAGGESSWIACAFEVASSDPNLPDWDSQVPVPDWGHDDRRWLVDVTGDGKADVSRAVGECQYFRYSPAVP
jgi:hypothetical protein